MLLVVDTSTAQVGLGLSDDGQILGEMMWTTLQHHTTELAPALAGLLARSSSSIDRINALGVALGPGSFTSLRVGLSFVKGLALARGVPLVGIPTLDIIAAAQLPSNKMLAAVIQAGRGRIAVGWYHCSENRWQSQGPARGTTLDGLLDEIKSPTRIAGELTSDERQRAAQADIEIASPADCVRRPAILAQLAQARLDDNPPNDAASLAPIYLHVAGAPPE